MNTPDGTGCELAGGRINTLGFGFGGDVGPDNTKIVGPGDTDTGGGCPGPGSVNGDGPGDGAPGPDRMNGDGGGDGVPDSVTDGDGVPDGVTDGVMEGVVDTEDDAPGDGVVVVVGVGDVVGDMLATMTPEQSASSRAAMSVFCAGVTPASTIGTRPRVASSNSVVCERSTVCVDGADAVGAKQQKIERSVESTAERRTKL